jgi:hypothetical protein
MKQKFKKIFLLFFIGSIATITFAQDSISKIHPSTPIPVEFDAGNNRFGLQFLVIKHFPNSTHFNILALTSFASDYKNNLSNLDFISNTQVSYEIWKGFGLAIGTSVNAKSGFVSVAAIEYVFANKQVLFVITPNIHISDSYNLEGLTVLEYKPALSKTTNLYSRFQALYNHNTKGDFHERSYIQLKLGLGIESYQFGLASNFDFYGPNKILKDNYGVFVRTNFN